MARLPYIDLETAPPAMQEALAALPPLNLFRMLAHADSAFTPYIAFKTALLSQLELDPKLRELAILLVAARTEAEYEWVQHVSIAQLLGVTGEQIAAVKHGELTAGCLDEDAVAVLRFTDHALERPRPDDETFAALTQRLPTRQIVELLLVIGTYQMLARVMTALDIELESEPVFDRFVAQDRLQSE
jgi:4-carboxymuconolactone decarboxylase